MKLQLNEKIIIQKDKANELKNITTQGIKKLVKKNHNPERSSN